LEANVALGLYGGKKYPYKANITTAIIITDPEKRYLLDKNFVRKLVLDPCFAGA
jgi:hypothetical protein